MAVVKVNKATGEIVARYRNAKEAAAENGMTAAEVYTILAKDLLTKTMCTFRFEDRFDPHEVYRCSANRPILCLDAETGKVVYVFASVHEAMGKLYVGQTTISQACIRNSVTVGKYRLRKLERMGEVS